MKELLPRNLASKSGIYESTSFFYMPQSWNMGQILSLSLLRKACWGLFGHPKNLTASNPRTGVPEASMLIIRPRKPLRIAFSTQKEKATGRWKIFHIDESYIFLILVKEMKWRDLSYAGLVTRMEREEKWTEILIEKLAVKPPLRRSRYKWPNTIILGLKETRWCGTGKFLTVNLLAFQD